MKMQKMYVLPASVFLLFLIQLSGCTPVISQATLQKVDKGLSFEVLQQNPEFYRGKMVLLGGDIIETKNKPSKTVVVVLARALDSRNRPLEEKGSKGRFIFYQPGFLDPAIYKPGRKISVAGVVVGYEVRPLGEITYRYPVIESREVYLWAEDEYYRSEPAVRFGIGVGIGL